MKLHELSLKEQLNGLKEGSFSSSELTQHYLDRISSLDKDLNSFITVTPDLALNQAKESDERYKSNKALPLDGIPIAHKDIFCTEDILTTCGSKMLSNFKAPYSSTVVENLSSDGVVVLGKTNMDEFAMGSSNETSFFGPVSNPWDNKLVPGGSAGGSAAGVALGQAAALAKMVANLTLGNDKYANGWSIAESVNAVVTPLLDEGLNLAQLDSEAFDAVVAGFKLSLIHI